MPYSEDYYIGVNEGKENKDEYINSLFKKVDIVNGLTKREFHYATFFMPWYTEYPNGYIKPR